MSTRMYICVRACKNTPHVASAAISAQAHKTPIPLPPVDTWLPHTA